MKKSTKNRANICPIFSPKCGLKQEKIGRIYALFFKSKRLLKNRSTKNWFSMCKSSVFGFFRLFWCRLIYRSADKSLNWQSYPILKINMNRKMRPFFVSKINAPSLISRKKDVYDSINPKRWTKYQVNQKLIFNVRK